VSELPARIQDERVLRGLALLEAREYFAAHEALEERWRELEAGDPWRDAMQGMIQLSVALEHMRRDNALGAFNVWQRSKAKLKGVPEQVAGIDILAWSQAVEAHMATCGIADRVKAQLEGGVAAGEEHMDAASFPALPPLADWPVPVFDAELSARLPRT
jgi:predicted metal-dependent hydrolase